MKSLIIIKSLIEQLLSQNEYEISQIYNILDSIEKVETTINDSHFDKDKDEKLLERLSYYASYLYTKADLLEDENTLLTKDNTYITIKNNVYLLDSSYSYDDLFAFINKYLDYFSFEDLAEIFITIKHIKMQQIIDATEKISQEEPIIHIDENTTEEVEDLAQEIENIEEEKSQLSVEEKIKAFLAFLYDEKNGTEIEQDKKLEFINNTYNLIQKTHDECEKFLKTRLCKFLTTNENRQIYDSYKKDNDEENLEIWISQRLPEFKNYGTFTFIDQLISLIKKCNNFLIDYMDLTELGSGTPDDLTFCYSYLKDNETISNPSFMEELNANLLKIFTNEKNSTIERNTRKNIIFYTPTSLNSGTENQDLFNKLKKFVSQTCVSDWKSIGAVFEPNQIKSIATKSYKDFPHNKYKSLATEFEFSHSTIRILGSHDRIIEENKKRLMDYYQADEMEIISIHNIFAESHGGANSGKRQSIGQYGYTPYYSQLHFYNILTKDSAWNDNEFQYICNVIEACVDITNEIITGNLDKLDSLSDKINQVLNDTTLLKNNEEGRKNDK